MALAVSAAYEAANANLERTPCYRATFTRNDVVVGRFSTHKISDYAGEIIAVSPSLFLRLSETSGIIAEDSSGNNLDGGYQNSPTLGAAGPLPGSSRTAVSLDGSTQYISVADNALLDPGDVLSGAVWVKINGPSFGNNYTILDKGLGGYHLRAVAFGGIASWSLAKRGTADIVSSTVSITLGVWTHVAWTKNGSTVHLYQDGVDTTGVVTNQTIATTATPLNIGRKSDATENLAGSMADVQLFATELSAATIKAIYQSSQLGYSAAWLPYMKLPRGVESQVIPERGQTSVGSIPMAIEDKDGVVTALISGDGIGGDTVTFQKGFDGLQGEEFQTFMVGLPSGCKLTTDLTGYEITIRDPQSLLNRQAFNVSASPLITALTDVATTAYVHDASGYLASGYLRNENEFMSYAAKTTGIEMPAGSWLAVVRGTSRYVALGTAGSLATSNDGVDWIERDSGNSDQWEDVILTSTGRLVAISATPSVMVSDDDGATWTVIGSIPSGNWVRLTEAPSLGASGRLIAVANAGTNRVMTSDNDGDTWTARTATARNYTDVIWSETAALAVAVSVSAFVETSADGITWAAEACPNSNWTAVEWSESLALFVAIAQSGGVNAAMTSAGAGAWAASGNTPASTWHRLRMLGNLIVAVGDGAVATSTDAATWTARTSASTNSFVALAVNGTTQIVAVSSNAADPHRQAMYSANGITWMSPVSSFTGLTRGVDLGSSVTVGAAHAVGTAVSEILYYEDTPLEVFLSMLTLTDKRGLSIDASYIDTAGIQAIQTALGTTEIALLIEQSVNAKTLFETEFFSKLGLYLRITGDGKISLVRFSEPVTAVGAVNHDNIVADASGYPILTWDQNLASVINAVTVYFDFDLISGEFKSSLEFTDAASITKFGRKPLVIESKGFRSALSGTADLIEAVATTILERYANGAPLVTARVFLQDHLIEAGDVIALTSALLPDRNTGLRGVTDALVEVTGRTIVFDSHYVDLSMLWTGWNL